VYGVDVQDHGALRREIAASAPNTNVISTMSRAELPKRHPDQEPSSRARGPDAFRNFTAKNCKMPVLISNTTHVRSRTAITNEPAAETSRINLLGLRGCRVPQCGHHGAPDGIDPVEIKDSTDVRIEA